MEHLSLEIFDLPTREDPHPVGSQYAALPDDASITITDTSEVFASGDVWSHSFTLNVAANAHIFGSAGEMHGSRLHDQIHKRRARLWVEGLPMFLGYLTLGDEAEVDDEGNVDVGFESGQKTFDDMIDGAKANQVPMMGDVEIGMALWRKRWTAARVKLTATATLDLILPAHGAVRHGNDDEVFEFRYDGEDDGNSVQEYPRMVFPRGDFENRKASRPDWTEDRLNTDRPYDEDEDGTPTNPYCNVALCYQKYGYEKKDKNGVATTDYSGEPEAQRGYEYMPADRMNSAPNFYVIYWLRALMKHLGIHVEENQMLGVEDLRRLFFVNTNCAYEEPSKLRTKYDERYGWYRTKTEDRKLIPEYVNPTRNINFEESGFAGKDIVATGQVPVTGLTVKVSEVLDWEPSDYNRYLDMNGYLHRAYATSDCFPNADISDTIKAIENGFGIRLLFSNDYRRVRVVLLRNLFRSKDVQQIDGDIVSRSKTENPIRGFRMTYGEVDDTAFHYKGFDDMLPHKKELWQDNSDTHDYSHWNLDADYASLINKISAFDKTCYVTKNNGNAYGIKIDKDAKRYDDLHPSLFGFADYMDAEDGDCSGDEETIETVNVGFTPAIMNDLNMTEEREQNSRRQRFALFVSEEMRPRRLDLNDGQDFDDPDAVYDVNGKLYAKEDDDGGYVYEGYMNDGIVKPGEFAIRSDMFAGWQGAMAELKSEFPFIIKVPAVFSFDGHINEGYRLYLQDNYEPNDDGVSPIEKHDWGLTLGIMRGSGGDAGVEYSADPDDGEGNDTWDIVPGSSVTAHPDTCDCYGEEWDYNGTQPGTGDDGDRISLKLRAEKPNPYFDPSKEEGDDNPRYLEITKDSLKRRGLCDRFYKEYSYWVRNARIANLTVRMELAQLLAIDKTKRVTVGDITGFVRKMQYSVSNKTGLGMVTMEIMYI